MSNYKKTQVGKARRITLEYGNVVKKVAGKYQITTYLKPLGQQAGAGSVIKGVDFNINPSYHTAKDGKVTNLVNRTLTLTLNGWEGDQPYQGYLLLHLHDGEELPMPYDGPLGCRL